MSAIREQLPLIPAYSSSQSFLYQGDAFEVLKALPSEMCRTSVTSPPYWGLRDYDTLGQIGSEDNIDDYVTKLTDVFRERVEY